MGRRYPNAGYGGRFSRWLDERNPHPYQSFGNGAAMRVSACAQAAKTLTEAKELSFTVTAVTHDHPEGLKGAEVVTVAIFLAREGKSKEEIRKEITERYYALDFTLDGIRDTYQFDETCPGSVPQALEAFLRGRILKMSSGTPFPSEGTAIPLLLLPAASPRRFMACPMPSAPASCPIWTARCTAS